MVLVVIPAQMLDYSDMNRWIGYNQTHNGTENVVNMYMYIITIKNSIQTQRDKKNGKIIFKLPKNME